MNGRSGRLIQQPAGYKAFIPAPLPPDPSLHLDDESLVLLSNADMALARLDGISYVLPNPDLFILMYEKKEAVLSSQIEGTQSSLADVLDYEAGARASRKNSDTKEVMNYLAALGHGIKRLEKLPLSSRLLREIHKILMTGVRGQNKIPGEFRKTQNWIGSVGASLREAAYVPPPATDIVQMMGDLEKFIHADIALPILVKCALIHYQFEAIHPFLDGNGRVGRLLVTFFLCWSGVLSEPMLYLSAFLNDNQQEYYDRLTAVRVRDDYEQWVAFFLRGVAETAGQAADTAKRVIQLQKTDREKIRAAGIESVYAFEILDNLLARPIITVPDVVDKLHISKQAATKIIDKLEKIGIVRETTGARRNRRYSYDALLELFG